ncbi:MAG: hypothetical protein K6G26_12495, partial [Lachnospiraceae bacterium]|nr:hypothetical protein [Lachnospiraceae bacterium]
MKKINYIYLYLIFVLFVTGCSNTSVNKDKKHDNVNSNNKYIIEYSSERNDYNSECFVGCGMKDGKQMYIFQNMPERFDFFDDEIESYGDNGFNYGLAYYEYNDGAFKMYKVISDDDVLKSNNIKWRYYDKINNKYFIYVEEVGSESQNYFYIFDIDSENDYNICLDCINQAEINYNLDMKALSDNIQMIDEYNFNDGLLDVYCKTENGILNIFR